MRMRCCLALAVLAALIALPATRAHAQEDFSGSSYITPYPEGDTYRLQAYGDVYAEGLLARLIEAMADDSRIQIQKKHRALPGLIRPDLEDELRVEEAGKEPVHIALVMIGAFDRFNMRASSGQWIAIGTDEWRKEYGRRADRLMKVLKRRGAAVYWVGQPIMRRPDINERAQTMNDIVREKAYLNGVKYIDVTTHFADEAGNYTAYGPDIAGKQMLMRDGEGVLFTWAGYRKLAHFVERELRRDLAQARNDRSIPLAGAEVEQKRIALLRPRPANEAWQGTITADKDQRSASPAKADPQASAQPAAAAFDAPGEQKADNGRISLKTVSASGREETVIVDLPRPAIPAAVIQLITRKDTGERASQMGEMLPEDLGGGLVVLNSVTSAATGTGVGTRRVSPGQPYYQVWIKGERLPPRAGRADDFSWPRPDPEIAGVPAPAQRPLRPASKLPPRS